MSSSDIIRTISLISGLIYHACYLVFQVKAIVATMVPLSESATTDRVVAQIKCVGGAIGSFFK
jgi:hypothetical protein